jgi:hypothetical protein
MDSVELDPTRIYEWYIIDRSIVHSRGRPYLSFYFGCVDLRETAKLRIRMPDDLKGNIIMQVMYATGYKDNGSAPDPLAHFKRGDHLFAKPVKSYIGGDVNAPVYSLAPDTITGSKQIIELPPDTRERIHRIVSNAPDHAEAIRRMGKTDVQLVFVYGQAVGAGVMDKSGNVIV